MSRLALAPRKAIEDVWSYPRPPLLQRTPNLLQVIWFSPSGEQTVIAETTEGMRVCETSHPPTYYLPPSSLKVPLRTTSKSSFCEWKGAATYHVVEVGGKRVENRIWSYERPTKRFEELKGYLSFYATSNTKEKEDGAWKCFVDGEQVGVQEG